MANFKLGQLIWEITGDHKSFDKSLSSSQKKVLEFSKKLTDVGKKLTTRLTVPILGLGAVIVKLASDAEEAGSKFDTVFNPVLERATIAAKDLADSYGLSSLKSKELLGDTGDLLTGFGFTADSALDLSVDVNQLAVDLASFTNFSGGAEGASAALTKALLGERESLKSLGISILEADVKARVLTLAQQGLTFETERQAKAYATLQLAQEQSGNAIGDFARTQDSFANQTRILKGDLQDLAIAFGEELLPAATDLIKDIKEVVQGFADLDAGTKRTIITVAAFAAAMGPALIVIGSLGKALVFLSANPIVLAIGAVGALALAVASLTKEWKDQKKVLEGGTTGDLEKDLKAINKEIDAQQIVVDEAVRKWGDIDSVTAKIGIQIEQDLLQDYRDLKAAIVDQIKFNELDEKSLESVRSTFDELSGTILTAVSSLEEFTDEEREAADLRKQFEEDFTTKVFEQSATRIEILEKERADALEIAEELGADIVAVNVFFNNEILEIEKETEEERNRIAEEAIQAEEDRKNEAIEIARDEQNEIDALREKAFEEEKARQDELIQKQEEVRDAYINTALMIAGAVGDIFQGLSDRKIQQLEKEGATEEELQIAKAKAARDTAIFNKTLALAEIAINTAVAVSKVIAIPPLAALVAALGVAQGIAVLAQPLPPIPSFGDGSILLPKPGGQLARVAEAGSAEAIIPLDDRGKDFIQDAFADEGSINITQPVIIQANMDGITTRIYSGFLKATKNGIAIMDARELTNADILR